MSRRAIHLHPRPSSLAPGAFTFVEVLFAIVILGIGSIMLAGMLPVAIKQTSDTRNEITGKSVCEAGFAYLQALSQTSPTAFPVTTDATKITSGSVAGLAAVPGRLVPLSHSVVAANSPDAVTRLGPHQSLYGSRISSSDPRFQWLAFYGRSEGSNLAHVIVVALHLSNVEGSVTVSSVTTPIDRYNRFTLANEAASDNNGPFLATAEIIEGGALDADRIVFDAGTAAQVVDSTTLGGAADGGAFVIVAASPNDPGTTGDQNRSARNNGRIFRLGTRRLDLDATGRVFDLAPGYDLAPAGPGVDGRINTADDETDGSMNTLPITDPAGGYPTSSTKLVGQPVQVWIIGRGLKNPGAAYGLPDNPYTGPVQDISILSADLPVSQ